MQSQDESTSEYERIESGFKEFEESGMRKAEELRSLVGHSPVFDDDGETNCPDDRAKQIFRDKEELDEEVSSYLESVHEKVGIVEEMMGRLDGNEGRIASGRGQLETEFPEAHMDAAELATRDAIYRATQLREGLQALAEMLEEVLAGSHGKQHPGELPERQPGSSGSDICADLFLLPEVLDEILKPLPPVPLPPPATPVGCFGYPGFLAPPTPIPTTFGTEIDGLISLGPDGGNPPPPGPPAPQSATPEGLV